jgi:ABC-type microcin C transport system duplicated ATPase subunit YejF
MLVVSHDLAVIWSLAQHVLVLRAGVVHEQGDTAAVFSAPRSDYTRSLLQAATRATRLAAACSAVNASSTERARL